MLSLIGCIALGQAPIYSITAGNGNGIRFWENDLWKMHMGIGTEYAYGPVDGYSIKLNMDATPGRGWTWGHSGSTPVAALSNAGHLQIAGTFTAMGDFNLGNTASSEGRWLRTGLGVYQTYPLNFGSNNKSGLASVWDTDGVFFGLSDEGVNRKDAVVAWGDDPNDMLRFIFNNAELMRLTPAGRLGVGTHSPESRLHVFESGSSAQTWRGRIVASGQTSAIVLGEFDSKAFIGGHNTALNAWSDIHLQAYGGNLAVGTNTATQKVEIKGNILLNHENSALGMDAQPNARLGFIKKLGNYPMIASDVSSPIIFAQTNHSGIFTNISSATLTERMRINVNGYVGIGTASPDQRLTVKGKIHSEEVIVDLSVPGPDYVFEPDYVLTSLAELSEYVTRHKHLPDVPTASEMLREGVKVGEMEMLLLKKIEELTLYLIEKDQQIKALEKKIDAVQKNDK